ncbi:MAG: AmmeMemoRadiSam system protein B [Thermoplasmata archaeon]
MRNSAVAGQFYPENKEYLKNLIREVFLHNIGPGKIASLAVSGPRNIVGGIVPHAGYIYSGPVAAHFYNALAEDGFPESFIIIGPNHYGIGPGVAITTQDFKTPLGIVKNDLELSRSIYRDFVESDVNAHLYEHSIEVQLPYLQFFNNNIKFVPILMLDQSYETAVKLGEIIKDAIKGKDVVIIASSDFSHYVPKEIAYKNDHLLIEKIIKMDLSNFYSTLSEYDISACGYGPMMAMLYALKGKPSLLKYATSGDVSRMDKVVGYTAIKVERR